MHQLLVLSQYCSDKAKLTPPRGLGFFNILLKAIARLLPNMQRTIVGRFRSRSDADGHLQCLRQLIPHASFEVVFDLEPDIEPATHSPATTEEVVS
jgi:hypothetical protein